LSNFGDDLPGVPQQARGLERDVKRKIWREVVTEFVVPLFLASLVVGLIAFWPFPL
jgi:hypothetical protein